MSAETNRNRATNQRLRNRAITQESKSQPCADCGISYPYYVMDFDHVRGEKEFFIGRGSWEKGRSRKRMDTLSPVRLRAEIAICDVVCSNCHRERTYQRSKMEACA